MQFTKVYIVCFLRVTNMYISTTASKYLWEERQHEKLVWLETGYGPAVEQ